MNEKDENKELDLSASEGSGNDAESQIPPEIFDKIPPPMRSQVSETIAMFAAGNAPNPLASKITGEHISKIIDNSSTDSQREHDLIVTKRRYILGYVLIGIVTFFLLALMFAKSDPDLFSDIVSHFAAIVAGFAAGWGFTAVNGSKGP